MNYQHIMAYAVEYDFNKEEGCIVLYWRMIRSTGDGRYVMPQDTFGVQYQEPRFDALSAGAAQLRIGTVTNGVVPVEWLGQPGLHPQTATNLAAPWVDDWATDGTNWTSGVETTNGLMSVTNWLVSGTATFFRLVGE